MEEHGAVTSKNILQPIANAYKRWFTKSEEQKAKEAKQKIDYSKGFVDPQYFLDAGISTYRLSFSPLAMDDENFKKFLKFCKRENTGFAFTRMSGKDEAWSLACPYSEWEKASEACHRFVVGELLSSAEEKIAEYKKADFNLLSNKAMMDYAQQLKIRYNITNGRSYDFNDRPLHCGSEYAAWLTDKRAYGFNKTLNGRTGRESNEGSTRVIVDALAPKTRIVCRAEEGEAIEDPDTKEKYVKTKYDVYIDGRPVYTGSNDSDGKKAPDWADTIKSMKEAANFSNTLFVFDSMDEYNWFVNVYNSLPDNERYLAFLNRADEGRDYSREISRLERQLEKKHGLLLSGDKLMDKRTLREVKIDPNHMELIVLREAWIAASKEKDDSNAINSAQVQEKYDRCAKAYFDRREREEKNAEIMCICKQIRNYIALDRARAEYHMAEAYIWDTQENTSDRKDAEENFEELKGKYDKALQTELKRTSDRKILDSIINEHELEEMEKITGPDKKVTMDELVKGINEHEKQKKSIITLDKPAEGKVRSFWNKFKAEGKESFWNKFKAGIAPILGFFQKGVDYLRQTLLWSEPEPPPANEGLGGGFKRGLEERTTGLEPRPMNDEHKRSLDALKNNERRLEELANEYTSGSDRAGQPSVASEPGEGGQPGGTDQPGGGGQPGGADQPGEGGQPSGADQPGGASEPVVAGQPDNDIISELEKKGLDTKVIKQIKELAQQYEDKGYKFYKDGKVIKADGNELHIFDAGSDPKRIDLLHIYIALNTGQQIANLYKMHEISGKWHRALKGVEGVGDDFGGYAAEGERMESECNTNLENLAKEKEQLNEELEKLNKMEELDKDLNDPELLAKLKRSDEILKGKQNGIEGSERKAKEEAERKVREEAERKEKEEAERKAKEEAERKEKEKSPKQASQVGDSSEIGNDIISALGKEVPYINAAGQLKDIKKQIETLTKNFDVAGCKFYKDEDGSVIVKKKGVVLGISDTEADPQSVDALRIEIALNIGQRIANLYEMYEVVKKQLESNIPRGDEEASNDFGGQAAEDAKLRLVDLAEKNGQLEKRYQELKKLASSMEQASQVGAVSGTKEPSGSYQKQVSRVIKTPGTNEALREEKRKDKELTKYADFASWLKARNPKGTQAKRKIHTRSESLMNGWKKIEMIHDVMVHNMEVAKREGRSENELTKMKNEINQVFNNLKRVRAGCMNYMEFGKTGDTAKNPKLEDMIKNYVEPWWIMVNDLNKMKENKQNGHAISDSEINDLAAQIEVIREAYQDFFANKTPIKDEIQELIESYRKSYENRKEAGKVKTQWR